LATAQGVRRHLATTDVARAEQINDYGFTQREVVTVLDVSFSVVARLWCGYQETREFTKGLCKVVTALQHLVRIDIWEFWP
jgi:transcriptional regulator with XRE-family HTH domain